MFTAPSLQIFIPIACSLLLSCTLSNVLHVGQLTELQKKIHPLKLLVLSRALTKEPTTLLLYDGELSMKKWLHELVRWFGNYRAVPWKREQFIIEFCSMMAPVTSAALVTSEILGSGNSGQTGVIRLAQFFLLKWRLPDVISQLMILFS